MSKVEDLEKTDIFGLTQKFKQNSNKKSKADFTKGSRCLPIAPCFDSKLKS